MIRLKRSYEAPEESDGFRVLVDRLWPRGIKKENLKADLWLKEIGPSKELRQAFHGGNISFEAFTERYLQELEEEEMSAALEKLKQIDENHETVTLLFGSKDVAHNQAVLLKQLIEKS